MGLRMDSFKVWLRALLADGESLKRSGNGMVGYTPASTTGTETLTNKTLTSPSFGNGASCETATVATTNATATTVWSKALTDSTVYLVTVTLVGRRTDGTAGRATYKRQVIVYVEGGSLTIGTPDTMGTDVESTAGYDITITNSSTTLQVEATGASGHTITWTAMVDICSASGA